MDQPNNNANPAPSSNDNQEDAQDQPKQEVNVDFTPEAPANDASAAPSENQPAPDGAIFPSSASTPGQDDLPSLASEEQPAPASDAATPSSDTDTLLDEQQLPPASQDVSRDVSSQSVPFEDQTPTQPVIDPVLPVNPTPGELGQPSEADAASDSNTAQPTGPAHAHTDSKTVMILGAVAVVLIGAIAFLMFS